MRLSVYVNPDVFLGFSFVEGYWLLVGFSIDVLFVFV